MNNLQLDKRIYFVGFIKRLVKRFAQFEPVQGSPDSYENNTHFQGSFQCIHQNIINLIFGTFCQRFQIPSVKKCDNPVDNQCESDDATRYQPVLKCVVVIYLIEHFMLLFAFGVILLCCYLYFALLSI